MSWWDGVPIASLYNGPPQDYPAAAAASSAAQSLQTGASGGFSQASIPVGVFPLDKQGRAVFGHFGGKVTGQATATTAIFNVGLATAANSIAGTSLVATPAITITSLSNVGWELDVKIHLRGSGYGTTTVSTSLLTTAIMSLSTLQSVAVPTLVTTIDASVTQWIYVTVTFSTASATNSCTMQAVDIYGMA